MLSQAPPPPPPHHVALSSLSPLPASRSGAATPHWRLLLRLDERRKGLRATSPRGSKHGRERKRVPPTHGDPAKPSSASGPPVLQMFKLMFCRNASRRRETLHIPTTTPCELSSEREIGNFFSTLLLRPPIWRRPARLSSGSSADSGNCLRAKLRTLSVHIRSSGDSSAQTSSPALPPSSEVAAAPSPMPCSLPLFLLLSRPPPLPSVPHASLQQA